MSSSSTTQQQEPPLIGVLALQGAFEEHQSCLEKSGCRTKQVRYLYFMMKYVVVVITII
jgi:glutamine amidotransferase PdxT